MFSLKKELFGFLWNVYVLLNKYLFVNLRPGIIVDILQLDYTTAQYYWIRLLLNDTLVEKQWTYVAFAYSKKHKLFSVYMNGLIKYQCYASERISLSDADFRIGARISVNYPEYFKGSLDELRIWNYPRSQSQIIECMKKEIDGRMKGLIGYWNFNEIVDVNSVLDATKYHHDGLITGALTLQNSEVF